MGKLPSIEHGGFKCSPGEVFTTVAEAKILIKEWHREYNQLRPHSALAYRPPALKVMMKGMIAESGSTGKERHAAGKTGK